MVKQHTLTRFLIYLARRPNIVLKMLVFNSWQDLNVR
jgi:hypothetical protein